MDSIIGLLIALSIIAIGFLLLPLPYGRTGGYAEIAKVFKAKRPPQASATYQTISVERGYGFLGQFTGVNFYFDKTGFFIFPMFKFWSWAMPTIFLPYDQLKIKKSKSLLVFTKLEINFPCESLPKLFIAGKYHPNFTM
jgi:hypothetical protein